MTSRELVIETLNHRQCDRVPVDLGGTMLTGMQVSSVCRLRQALRLDPPGTPVAENLLAMYETVRNYRTR